jgi:hypothetical protein
LSVRLPSGKPLTCGDRTGAVDIFLRSVFRAGFTVLFVALSALSEPRLSVG